MALERDSTNLDMRRGQQPPQVVYGGGGGGRGGGAGPQSRGGLQRDTSSRAPLRRGRAPAGHHHCAGYAVVHLAVNK